MTASEDDALVLSVRDLSIDIIDPRGAVRVVDSVSFDVRRNEVFSIVGESGSGKSITMLAIMGLLVTGRVRIAGGEILLQGRNLRLLSPEQLRAIRGKTLSMIFQDPMTSLNPVLTVGSQIAEIITIHNPALAGRRLRERVIELLSLVGMPNPERRYRQYPHEFSGGMRQRSMIAMAMANDPALLIADEPTTALDVTIQAQVMEVLADIRARTGASMILITHDLGLVADYADRVAVMYGGTLVENARAEDLLTAYAHPYTGGLLASLPTANSLARELYAIPGQPPDLRDRPAGCVFNSRCALRQGRARCTGETPLLKTIGTDHEVACHFSGETSSWARTVGVAAPGFESGEAAR